MKNFVFALFSFAFFSDLVTDVTDIIIRPAKKSFFVAQKISYEPISDIIPFEDIQPDIVPAQLPDQEAHMSDGHTRRANRRVRRYNRRLDRRAGRSASSSNSYKV